MVHLIVNLMVHLMRDLAVKLDGGIDGGLHGGLDDQGLFSGARTRDSRAIFKILALRFLGREQFSRCFQNSHADIFGARGFFTSIYLSRIIDIYMLNMYH